MTYENGLPEAQPSPGAPIGLLLHFVPVSIHYNRVDLFCVLEFNTTDPWIHIPLYPITT
ncbi:hypothetical protein AG1IA_03637 [Rhizoctonia solani AG-1 IA]|uniref:Uncharacterized protein n=1 Tax=Thanatephorus cucumeris (strain AG1-IA) TaxID=983506 RepID=L8WZU0_THACA|nr:hypothetical protein AG1IA_03637 [Rhizoctonia solani AG-1 IA]